MDNLDDLGDAAGEILDELSPAPKTETDATLLEALRRIEEANLFYTLIKTDIFKSSSARPDILNSVNSKIKQFAKSELNKLLNISQGASQESGGLGIPKDEVLALRVLASKILKKDPNSIMQDIRRPAINAVDATPIAIASSPTMNEVRTPPAVVQEPVVDSKIVTTPPTADQKIAARNALLAKARKAQADKRARAKEPQAAQLPAGGHQGYAVPSGYVPPGNGGQVIHNSPAVTANGLNVGKLVSEITGNQASVVTLSDAPIGGDPNARL